MASCIKNVDGEIMISFFDHDDHLEINVKDNGVGRKAAAEMNGNKNDPHTSFGIEVTTRQVDGVKNGRETPSGIEILILRRTEPQPEHW